MSWTKRIAPIVAATAIGVGGVAGPALGASSTHWSTTKCKSYKTSFKKRHAKPTKAQKSAANKVLKRHGCTVKV
jgi:hypothetical protein